MLPAEPKDIGMLEDTGKMSKNYQSSILLNSLL
jgi:CRISPR/Cas system-associated endonuclease Cas3-HD